MAEAVNTLVPEEQIEVGDAVAVTVGAAITPSHTVPFSVHPPIVVVNEYMPTALLPTEDRLSADVVDVPPGPVQA